MSSQLTVKKLKNGIIAYKKSIKNKGKETTSCIFELKTLEEFIDAIEKYNEKTTKRVDAVRIHLIRSGIIKRHKKLSDKKTIQLGFAIIPATNRQGTYPSRIKADDCVDQNGLIWIVPGYSHETSGLCPDNCGGELVP